MASRGEHIVDVDIRWSDMDEYGHVSHLGLIAIAEHGRSRWLDRTLGVEPGTWPYVIVHLELDFRSTAMFTDRRLCSSFTAERVGTSSVTLRERFVTPSGDLVMESQSVIVAWDTRRAESRALTSDETSRLTVPTAQP